MCIFLRELNRSLQAHTAYWIIMVLVMALSLSGIYMIRDDVRMVKYHHRAYSKNMTDRTIYYLVYDIASPTRYFDSAANRENMQAFYNELSRTEGITAYTNAHQSVELLSDIPGLPASFNTFSGGSYVPEEYANQVRLDFLMVSDNIGSVFEIQPAEGRWFSEDSFHYDASAPVEVVLGSGYREFMTIGDQFSIEFNTSNMTLDVVGFLPEGALIPSTGGNVLILDRSILCPAFTSAGTINSPIEAGAEEFMGMVLINSSTPNIIQEDPSIDVKVLVSAVAAQFAVPPVETIMISYEDLSMIKSSSGQDVSITTTLSALILSVFFVTLVILIASKIRMNMKAYSLYLLTGGSPLQVFAMMMGEMLIFVSCATLIGLAALQRILPMAHDITYMSGRFFETAAVLLGAAAVITLVQVWRIRLADMIRRDRT